MGRSVSFASGSEWVLYTHLDFDEGRIFECRRCGHEHERDDDTEPDACESCGNVGFYGRDRYPAEDVWSDFLADLRTTFKRAFPSLCDCDRWLDREDHAVLENRHAYIGASEYCGLVSVWCVPKQASWYDTAGTSALRAQWAASIERKAARLLESFAPRLVPMGTFSNGESVYRRVS